MKSAHKDVTSFKAVIESGGNQWKTVPAELKDDGFVEFNCLRLNSFGLASTPKMTEGVVDPSGKILSTGNDGRSNTVFIEGCVTSKQKYQYSVQRPDPEYNISEKNNGRSCFSSE